MKTKTINLYTFDELSSVVQDKVIAKFRNENEHDFLGEYMLDMLDQNIKDYGITAIDRHVGYMLTNCQGDGAMFYGRYSWKDYTITIKQTGRYTHSHSKIIEMVNTDTDVDAPEDAYKAFEAIYQTVCRELERAGYAAIDAENSEESIVEMIKDNEYTFRDNGVMEN